ncbi:tyrosine-type recombinase/integrase [Sphingomonas tabacisoli]|uniref:Tyrosine-type recombinase/integrase n=1 Tax=Sphingomonas tabacisoli TaxID=2249466 RepID=A0ABW4I466_9SPHN
MLAKQAKVLSPAQVQTVLAMIGNQRHPSRNRLIFLLSIRAGLRAKEIASLTWAMVTDAEGHIGDCIRLPNQAAKGQSGGVIPMARELRAAVVAHAEQSSPFGLSDRVIQTERSKMTTAQVIVNLFRSWFQALGFDGCSSHSGRRTFITRAARNIGRFGGSLRDVQALARHRSLATTQRYIEIDAEAMRKVVDA